MQTLTISDENTDDIRGVTLEERARLVLLTLGRTSDRIQKAYRRLAMQHHPDVAGGNSERFQMIREAYELLMEGTISKRPLLADDGRVVALIGRRVQPLLDKQKEWEEYERWRRRQFFGEHGELL